jgi:hypothetical protein
VKITVKSGSSKKIFRFFFYAPPKEKPSGVFFERNYDFKKYLFDSNIWNRSDKYYKMQSEKRPQ